MLPLVYNGQPIPIREDGYLNATAMCQAGGKPWSNWWRLDTTQALITALEGSLQIRRDLLVESISTGPNDQRGTWVHKEVALGLAHWISAEFYATCIGVLTGRVQHEPASAPSRIPQLDHIRQLKETLDCWGIRLDERDLLQVKSYAMQVALPPAGGIQGIYNDIPLSRAVMEEFGVVLSNSKLGQIGKHLARLFRREFEQEPAKHDQQVDGAVRSVAHYDRTWLVPQLHQLKAERPDLFTR